MRGVSLNEVFTIGEAAGAPPSQALAMRLSEETRIRERRMSDEKKIRRDLEFDSIKELLKSSAFIEQTRQGHSGPFHSKSCCAHVSQG